MRPSPDTEINWFKVGGSIAGILRRAGITTIGHLQLLSEVKLLSLDQMGRKRIEEVKHYLWAEDLSLRGSLSLSCKAAEVYGSVQAMPIRMLIVLLGSDELSSPSLNGMVKLFTALGMHVIGDVPCHRIWCIEETLTKAQLMTYERMCGWLIGAGVHER